jgi:biotin transport system substrate-specific component
MEAIFKKEIILNKALCRIISVAVFVILTTLGAFVRIPLPFSPVPLTLQTLFVLLSGAILGSNLGTISQLSYILLGVAGIPIFTGAGSGLVSLFGPTGGYLWGFIFAAMFTGRFITHTDKLSSVFGILCIADLLILVCGTVWLKFLSGYSLGKVLLIGFIPFIPGDLLKAWSASILYMRLKPRLIEIL